MTTTQEKLNEILYTKSKLKEAINNAGGNISDNTNFGEYPREVESIYANVKTIYTSSEMDSLLTSNNVGKIYRYLGVTNEKYKKGLCYIVEGE